MITWGGSSLLESTEYLRVVSGVVMNILQPRLLTGGELQLLILSFKSINIMHLYI